MYLKIAFVAIVASLLFTACGSSKKAKTPEQKAALDRGVQMNREECEELALKDVKAWRESGNGVSPKESLARNAAELNAKARLARQLQEQINTFIRSYNEQYEAEDVLDLSGKLVEIDEGYAEQLLSGVKVICNNTYVKPDGTYNAYVCVEMSENSLSRIHKKLTDDKKLSIDFGEDRFLKDMEKAKEDYRRNR
ncbi:MAG: hypothetical protein LBC68_11925 [Prevotellaceae bacterium]|nr:hypothetical protein [Prevotellaceae bacterium]